MTRPVVPLLLGAAGVIPFVAATAWLVGTVSEARVAAFAVAAYGIAILAFLGGVHWGRALGLSGDAGKPGPGSDYLWSVLPSLAGVAALALSPPLTLATLAAAFTFVGCYDVAFFRRRGPAWYARLRVVLTVVVVLLLAVASAFAPNIGPAFGLFAAVRS